jgi:GT2 family glycosyltransferase
MHLSIILPCYNAASVLSGQLDALAAQQWPCEWRVDTIFVDNLCTDDSVGIVQQYRSRLSNLQIVQAYARRSTSYARNTGARRAAGDALLFCDADDEVGTGWLMEMGKALRTYDFVACRFDSRKLNPAWLCEGRGTPQKDSLQRLWYPPYLLYAGGSSLGIRRDVHERVGGFDESMAYIEDAEYCIRVQQHTGQELRFVPDAVVHIRHRTNLRLIAVQAYRWGQYNECLYRRYRRHDGKDRERWHAYAAEWGRLIKNMAVWLRFRGGRVILMTQLGWQLGLLKGMLRYRIPPATR